MMDEDGEYLNYTLETVVFALPKRYRHHQQLQHLRYLGGGTFGNVM
jgi:hypothetical protein